MNTHIGDAASPPVNLFGGTPRLPGRPIFIQRRDAQLSLGRGSIRPHCSGAKS
jgi:hypothetical protein